MKNSELKEYLNKFPDDASVGFILANPRRRKLYEIENILYVTDQEKPIFCINVGEERDMDTEMAVACEEDERSAENIEGQMELSDYPGVMPGEQA